MRWISALLAAALLAACGGNPLLDVGASKRASVEAEAPVVVFIPGTLASVLTDSGTGEVIYGGSGGVSVDPTEPRNLRRLSRPLDGSRDAIVATDVLREAEESVLLIPVSTSIYGEALEGLAAAGLQEAPVGTVPAAGPALAVFPYDWRGSVVEAAQALGRVLERRGPGARKVRIVAHSMGGLVALWYAMHGTADLGPGGTAPPLTWAGAAQVERIVLVGTPLAGSAIALRNTVEGNDLAGPLTETFPPAMLASHPSTYELLPREPFVAADGAALDARRPETWIERGWGMADPDQRRAVAALGTREQAVARQSALLERGRAVQAALDRRLAPPRGLEIVAVAGTGNATPARLDATPDGIEVSGSEDGDGTVTRLSASPPGLRTVEIEASHLGLVGEPGPFGTILSLALD